VIKHVVNDNGGTRTAGDFTLSVTGTPANPASFSGAEAPGTSVTVDAGSYSVDEGAVSGYTKSLSADCAGTIANGETKTCTITNDDEAAHLTVIKHVVNDNGGTRTAGDFTLSVTATSVNPASFAGAEAPGTPVLLDAGSYSVDEGAVSGYTKSLSTDCAGTIANGETKTCTITNNDEAAHLTVIKHVINDNGGTRTAGDFTLSVTATSVNPASFAGAEAPGTPVLLDAGSYSVDEGAVSGYSKSLSTGCAGTIANGETKSCTITNNDIPGTLSWEKRLELGTPPHPIQGGATFSVTPDPSTGTGSLTGISDCTASPCAGADQDPDPGEFELVNVSLGSYTIEETAAPAGFGLDDDATRAQTVDVSNLDAVVGAQGVDDDGNTDESDFHNRLGTIQILKVSQGGDGSFGFGLTGHPVIGADFTDATPFDGDQAVIATISGSGAATRSNVLAGSYTVTEAATAGFALANLVCTASPGSSATPDIPTATANLTIAGGGSVTCTYTNAQAAGPTRTLGFWATHLSYASSAWLTIPAAARQQCTVARTVGVAELEGAFWSDIAKTSTGVRRSALDQARMQLVQQLEAAMLNATFGISSSDQANIAGAAAAYCNPTATRAALTNWVSILTAFNQSGDTVPLPGNPGPANSKEAQAAANKPFWDGPLP
jgi:hypothetical protein